MPLPQRLEERLRGHQIGGTESLGEAAVDGGQQLARLTHSLLSVPQPSEAHSGPQLPGESALISRNVERPVEALLGGLGSGRHSLQEMKLPLRAEQLREAPSRFRLLGPRQRVVDHTQPLGNVPGTAETRG